MPNLNYADSAANCLMPKISIFALRIQKRAVFMRLIQLIDILYVNY